MDLFINCDQIQHLLTERGQTLHEATGSKRSKSASAGAKYDGRSLREAKIEGLV